MFLPTNDFELEMKYILDYTSKKNYNTDFKIGIFPLSASYFRIDPTWTSEIERAPISITKRQFPNIIHFTDITKINVEKIPSINIVTFDTSQKLSNIGKRKVLTGSQSRLFYHTIRIMEEIRCTINGIYPVITV